MAVVCLARRSKSVNFNFLTFPIAITRTYTGAAGGIAGRCRSPAPKRGDKRMISRTTIMVVAASVSSVSPAAAADPVRWSANGHFYQFVLSDRGWSQSLTEASQLAPLRNGKLAPYLATITSAEENAFVGMVMGGNRAWLAGSDAVREGIWQWVAGPEAGQVFFGFGAAAGAYSNWNVNEPNNGVFRNEHSLEIRPDTTAPYRWNDLPNNDFRPNGYIVEWSLAPQVPEPATWAMMIIGFGLAGAAQRRQRHVLA